VNPEIIYLPSPQHYILTVLEDECLSIREFALLIEYDHSYLSKLCRRQHCPTPRIIRKIALGLSALDGVCWKVHAENIRRSS